MEIFIKIISVLILLDASFALVFCFVPKLRRFYKKFKFMQKSFPLTRGWCLLYFVLALMLVLASYL